jgi:hypothetical protein
VPVYVTEEDADEILRWKYLYKFALMLMITFVHYSNTYYVLGERLSSAAMSKQGSATNCGDNRGPFNAELCFEFYSS